MVAVAIPGFAVVFLFIRSRRRVAAMKLASQEDVEVATPQPIDLIADHNFHHSSSTTPPFPPPPLLQFFTKTHQIQDEYCT